MNRWRNGIAILVTGWAVQSAFAVPGEITDNSGWWELDRWNQEFSSSSNPTVEQLQAGKEWICFDASEKDSFQAERNKEFYPLTFHVSAGEIQAFSPRRRALSLISSEFGSTRSPNGLVRVKLRTINRDRNGQCVGTISPGELMIRTSQGTIDHVIRYTHCRGVYCEKGQCSETRTARKYDRIQRRVIGTTSWSVEVRSPWGSEVLKTEDGYLVDVRVPHRPKIYDDEDIETVCYDLHNEDAVCRGNLSNEWKVQTAYFTDESSPEGDLSLDHLEDLGIREVASDMQVDCKWCPSPIDYAEKENGVSKAFKNGVSEPFRLFLRASARALWQLTR